MFLSYIELMLAAFTVAELRKGGELRGHWGMTCGRLEGFDFHKMQTAAAYIMLVDRDMVKGK